MEVKQILNFDRRLTVRTSEHLNLLKNILHEIVIEDLRMRKICAKLVRMILTDEQKGGHVKISQELDFVLDTNFQENLITGDDES